MTIRLHNSPVVCGAKENESILISLARAGIILSAPCGGRRRCGKCKVRLVSGQVTGDTPDEGALVHACLASAAGDITIECLDNFTIISSEIASELGSPTPSKNRAGVARTGVALDIGTTTVAAKLVDLDTGSPLDTAVELNDQRSFGADVMSRIEAARGGGTAGLFTAINRQTQRILAGFTERWGLGQIEKLSVSGNTTMLHLFLNIDPSGMGEYPFTPVFLDAREMPGHGLSFSAKSVSVLPSISAFVGGDITAGLAALDILNAPDPSLLIDIGTNGEMALFHRGGVYCCATAAGPAFEGAEISCGMSGISGAISAVELASDGSLSVTTIGGQPPRGVCGSGLIDAVAVMLKQGVIDETGLMENHPAGYPLACGVSIVNRDIRQFQLAKSAIFSGVKILCKNAGVATDDIKNVYIAGGFGFFINKKNSSYVGLFPKDFADRLSICGNLSLQGAEEALLSKDFMERCGQIISRCSVVDLSADPDFMNEFAENMLFDP